jgi:hypothetical protein
MKWVDPPDLQTGYAPLAGKIHEKTQTNPHLRDRSRGTEALGNTPLADNIDLHAYFFHLKPSTTAISIRLPLGLLEQIKIVANKHVPVAYHERTIPIAKNRLQMILSADADIPVISIGA